MKRTLVRTRIGVFLLVCLAACAKGPPDPRRSVALYADRGCWKESIQAAEKMFQWMGYRVTRVIAPQINAKGLDGFDVLCVPGGDMYYYAQDLSTGGEDNIKRFVRDGGAYVGICAGAYFAAEKVIWRGSELHTTPLAIFPGVAEGPDNDIAPYPGYGMCRLNLVDREHPVTQGEPDSAWMLYYWGPALIPNRDADVTVLARYDTGQQPAALALEYGRGRVFLIGTHPEIEEDSDRDGVTFSDELDDQGSDWDLMQRAAAWCLRE